jgi:hypothetical protein
VPMSRSDAVQRSVAADRIRITTGIETQEETEGIENSPRFVMETGRAPETA